MHVVHEVIPRDVTGITVRDHGKDRKAVDICGLQAGVGDGRGRRLVGLAGKTPLAVALGLRVPGSDEHRPFSLWPLDRHDSSPWRVDQAAARVTWMPAGTVGG